MKKLWSENKSEGMNRACKSCGCELVSTSKSKYCANCKKEKSASLRNNGLALFGIVATAILGSKIKGGGPTKS